MNPSEKGLRANGREYVEIREGVWKHKPVKAILFLVMALWIALLPSCIVVRDHPHHGWHRWHGGGEHREGEHR